MGLHRHDQHLLSKKHRKLQQQHDKKAGKHQTHKDKARARKALAAERLAKAVAEATAKDTDAVFAAMDAIGEQEAKNSSSNKDTSDNANAESKENEETQEDTLLQQSEDDDDAWLADAVANITAAEAEKQLDETQEVTDDKKEQSEANVEPTTPDEETSNDSKTNADDADHQVDDDNDNDDDSDSDSDSSSIDLADFVSGPSHSSGWPNMDNEAEDSEEEDDKQDNSDKEKDNSAVGESTNENDNDNEATADANDTKSGNGWKVRCVFIPSPFCNLCDRLTVLCVPLIQALLTKFYTAHNPEKLGSIPTVLQKYSGKEEVCKLVWCVKYVAGKYTVSNGS